MASTVKSILSQSRNNSSTRRPSTSSTSRRSRRSDTSKDCYKTCIDFCPVPADGNCFFSAIYKSLEYADKIDEVFPEKNGGTSIDGHMQMRRHVADLMKRDKTRSSIVSAVQNMANLGLNSETAQEVFGKTALEQFTNQNVTRSSNATEEGIVTKYIQKIREPTIYASEIEVAAKRMAY